MGNPQPILFSETSTEVKPGDNIYVPDFNEIDPSFGRRHGGRAEVERVCIGEGGKRYITVREWSGHFELKWDDFLLPRQQELAKLYGVKRAYLQVNA
jgi:hypothetical protein